MSTIVTSNVSDGTLSIPTTYVTNGSAKAWVNFDGSGTIATRDSLNVTSLTDNGTGDYTVNFSSAMVDDNYAFFGAGGSATADGRVLISQGLSQLSLAGSIRVASSNSTTAGLTDYPRVNVSVQGELA